MSFNTLMGLYGLLCIALGIVVGRALPRRGQRVGADHLIRPVDGAPSPADLGYDPMNPMNAGRTPETVEICGAEWTVMRPLGK